MAGLAAAGPSPATCHHPRKPAGGSAAAAPFSPPEAAPTAPAFPPPPSDPRRLHAWAGRADTGGSVSPPPAPGFEARRGAPAARPPSRQREASAGTGVSRLPPPPPRRGECGPRCPPNPLTAEGAVRRGRYSPPPPGAATATRRLCRRRHVCCSSRGPARPGPPQSRETSPKGRWGGVAGLRAHRRALREGGGRQDGGGGGRMAEALREGEVGAPEGAGGSGRGGIPPRLSPPTAG